MSNSDDLDDVFGPLRSTATTPELANEATTVDAMAHAHNASKGRITMLNSRKARVATLIAAGIIGFGGVAAAGAGGFQSLELPDDEPAETTIATTVPDEPEEIEQPETTTETTEVRESSVVTTTEAPAVETAQKEEAEEADVPVASVKDDPDPDTDFNENTCLPGNHGKSVSAAARGDDNFEGKNQDGLDAEVRDVAHSSCGKQSDGEHEEEAEAEKAADSDDDDNSDDDESGHDDDDDDHDEKAEKPAKKSGNSASKDKGSNARGKNKKGD